MFICIDPLNTLNQVIRETFNNSYKFNSPIPQSKQRLRKTTNLPILTSRDNLISVHEFRGVSSRSIYSRNSANNSHHKSQSSAQVTNFIIPNSRCSTRNIILEKPNKTHIQTQRKLPAFREFSKMLEKKRIKRPEIKQMPPEFDTDKWIKQAETRIQQKYKEKQNQQKIENNEHYSIKTGRFNFTILSSKIQPDISPEFKGKYELKMNEIIESLNPTKIYIKWDKSQPKNTHSPEKYANEFLNSIMLDKNKDTIHYLELNHNLVHYQDTVFFTFF